MVNIRNILLIGRTGSGKSTLANVLTGTNEFIESAKSISVTKNIEERVVEIDLKEDGSEKIRYRVIDTIGIGDTKLTPQGVLTKLAEMAGRVKREGLNQILFITRGRFSKEETEAYDLLSSIIFDSEVLKYTTVVRVGFPEFEEREICDEDRWELREENPKLAHILNSIKDVLYLDNPPIKGRNAEANKEIREESRKRLLTHLAGCQDNYRPSNIDTLDKRVEEYRTDEQKLKDKMKELEKIRKEQEEKFRREMDELKAQQKEELRALREKADRDIENVRAEGKAELKKTVSEMESKQQKEMDKLRQENKEQIKELKDTHRQETQQIIDANRRQMESLQAQNRQDREATEQLRRELQQRSDSSTREISSALAQFSSSSNKSSDSDAVLLQIKKLEIADNEAQRKHDTKMVEEVRNQQTQQQTSQGAVEQEGPGFVASVISGAAAGGTAGSAVPGLGTAAGVVGGAAVGLTGWLIDKLNK